MCCLRATTSGWVNIFPMFQKQREAPDRGLFLRSREIFAILTDPNGKFCVLCNLPVTNVNGLLQNFAVKLTMAAKKTIKTFLMICFEKLEILLK